jgi:hypothetical protein
MKQIHWALFGMVTTFDILKMDVKPSAEGTDCHI